MVHREQHEERMAHEDSPAKDHLKAPPVWSLRLLLNVTHTFTRLPNRSIEVNNTAASGEVA